MEQDEPKIERFLRNDDGTWTFAEASDLDAVLFLPSLDIELLLSEIYDKVDFFAPRSR